MDDFKVTNQPKRATQLLKDKNFRVNEQEP